jgi:aerotaxis receptor
MRTNLPVTNVEYPLHDDTLIVSKTDLKGKLSYFNDQFVDAAGFTEAELIGQPHNIIRHPDMPPEAFEDLWVTLKAGKPWAGAVKNRRKNGDFYWVLASATPIWENGRVTGYMSIRSKLAADQRAEAEHVYALLRAKKAQKYTVTAGVIRRRSFADRFAFFTRTLKARLVTLISVQSVFMVIIALEALFGSGQREFTIASGVALAILALGLLLGGLLGLQTIRAVGRPLEQLNAAMAKIAQGLFNSRIVIERDDELGVALRNVQAMQAKLGFDREEQNDTEKRVALQRKADMMKLADGFEGAVGQIVETVSSASTQLEASAGTLTSTAERAQATGEIGQQITSIQGATQESVNAIQAISGTIERLSEIASTIAAAVEEQGAATQEISRNVQQAAQGTQQVSSNITDVQRGASETGSASAQVLSAAQSLSSDSNRLKLEVGRFLDSVRAA